MHLTPHEQERLMIHLAADVAEKRKGRVALNYAEVMALLTAYVLEQAREGKKTVATVMAHAKTLLKYVEVMSGVPEMIEYVQVEATFRDGTKLVTLRDLEFDNVASGGVVPGEVEHRTQDGDEVCHNDGKVTPLKVRNDDDRMRPIQVGSHYHFYEANPALTFLDADNQELPNRDVALGMRLNVPAGSSVRFEHGVPVDVELVPIRGKREVPGLRGDTTALPPLTTATQGAV